MFEFYFYYKNKYILLLEETFGWHIPTQHPKFQFFPFLPQWLVMGRKHTQKQNEIINELYLGFFFFNLLREFFQSIHNMSDTLPNGFYRKEQKIVRVNRNMKIWNLNFFFTTENYKEMGEPISCRREGGASERETAQFSIPGQVNNLTEFQFHHWHYQPYPLIVNSKKWCVGSLQILHFTSMPRLRLNHSYCPFCVSVLLNFPELAGRWDLGNGLWPNSSTSKSLNVNIRYLRHDSCAK